MVVLLVVSAVVGGDGDRGQDPYRPGTDVLIRLTVDGETKEATLRCCTDEPSGFAGTGFLEVRNQSGVQTLAYDAMAQVDLNAIATDWMFGDDCDDDAARGDHLTVRGTWNTEAVDVVLQRDSECGSVLWSQLPALRGES